MNFAEQFEEGLFEFIEGFLEYRVDEIERKLYKQMPLNATNLIKLADESRAIAEAVRDVLINPAISLEDLLAEHFHYFEMLTVAEKLVKELSEVLHGPKQQVLAIVDHGAVVDMMRTSTAIETLVLDYDNVGISHFNNPICEPDLNDWARGFLDGLTAEEAHETPEQDTP